MNLSAGKWLGLRRIADESGLFKIVAVDQRPPIQNFIKSTLGSDEATWEDVAEVKRVLAESLADESSAVLMDPLFAWPAAHSVMRRDHGLMLTLEHDGVKYMREINALSTQHANPWTTHPLHGSGVQMQYSTKEFARLYSDF
jgi:tagatose-1,6-bisphosphate aldolase